MALCVFLNLVPTYIIIQVLLCSNAVSAKSENSKIVPKLLLKYLSIRLQNYSNRVLLSESHWTVIIIEIF